MDPKKPEVAAEKPEPKRFKVTALSREPRGHWRAGKYWAAGPSSADLTEKQIAELRSDSRIVIIEGTPPSADEVLEKMREEKAEEEALARAKLDQMKQAERQRAGEKRGR